MESGQVLPTANEHEWTRICGPPRHGPGVRRADMPVCRFGRLSSRPAVGQTRKSGEPAGWKACPTSMLIAGEQVRKEREALPGPADLGASPTTWDGLDGRPGRLAPCFLPAKHAKSRQRTSWLWRIFAPLAGKHPWHRQLPTHAGGAPAEPDPSPHEEGSTESRPTRFMAQMRGHMYVIRPLPGRCPWSYWTKVQ